MQTISNIFIFLLFLILTPSFTYAQEQQFYLSDDLPIDQIIAKLKENNLYPDRVSEVAVVGNVMRPGIIELKNGLSLIEAIAFQGGLKRDASVIVRIIKSDQDGNPDETLIDLRNVRTGKTKYTLQGGEIIFALPGKRKPQIYQDFILPIKIFTNYG